MDIPEFALSIRQPWAWAIVAGHKDVENRGPVFRLTAAVRSVAIHASQGMTRDEYEIASSFMFGHGVDCPRPDDLVRGAIIGVATIIGVTDQSDSPWFFGPHGLLVRAAQTVEPIPCPGALGYFRWSAAGVVAEPKPWMVAWPGEHTPRRAPKTAPQAAPMPLFR